jgi:hypothetical protein
MDVRKGHSDSSNSCRIDLAPIACLPKDIEAFCHVTPGSQIEMTHTPRIQP